MKRPTFYCPKCDTKNDHSAKYDSYFCMQCDEWREKKCSDKTCGYCLDRPSKPSLA